MDSRPLYPLTTSALLIGRDAVLELWRERDPCLDPVDALILATVIQANVDSITGTPQEQLAYSALAAPPPQAARRRVSISRVADSIDLRFETVRRRIKRLEAAGFMETTRSGVLVPESYFLSPANAAAVVGVDRIAASAFRRLDAIGFFADQALPEPVCVGGEHPYRAVARLFMTYALRVGAEMRVLAGDFSDLLLILQLTHLNTAHLGDGRSGFSGREGDALATDAQMQPVSVSALSRSASAPFETTRRRLARLAARGLCQPVDGGYIVPEQAVRVFARQLAPLNEMNLIRLYRGCALVGAVAGWRRQHAERPPQRAAG